MRRLAIHRKRMSSPPKPSEVLTKTWTLHGRESSLRKREEKLFGMSAGIVLRFIEPQR